MKLYYYDKHENFGDRLNEWLWERLLPGCWDPGDGIYFSGIGTIINSSMPMADRHWVVFTSGAGYGGPPVHFGNDRWKIVSVRGPLSAKVLGLPAAAAVTDGAILLAGLGEHVPLPSAERDGIVFVPHHQVDAAGDWSEICRNAGVEYLSPTQDSRRVVERLRGAKLVLADAMHAAIVADTLRVPWVPLVSSPRSSTFKWLDWTRSMELPYEPVRLPARTAAAKVQGATFWMSGEHNLLSAYDEPSVLAHFERQSRLKKRRWWPLARRAGKRLQREAVRLAHAWPLAGLREPADQRQFDRTVEALTRAARSPGILSDDRIFANRLDALVARLEIVRSFAA